MRLREVCDPESRARQGSPWSYARTMTLVSGCFGSDEQIILLLPLVSSLSSVSPLGPGPVRWSSFEDGGIFAIYPRLYSLVVTQRERQNMKYVSALI